MTAASNTSGPKTASRKVVLYGREELARLAWFCLSHDSDHEVAGFTVAAQEMPAQASENARFCGLPLVPFEALEQHFPPAGHDLLIAIGPHQVNAPRARRFEEGKARGYRFASYVSSRASLWPDLKLGAGCMIFEQAVIEPFSRIGDNVVLRANVQVSHDGVVGDHVFLAPRVVMAGACRVEQRAFLGVNTTLSDSVTVAADCVVGAGAVVTRSTEPGGLYVGVPARRAGLASEVKVWP